MALAIVGASPLPTAPATPESLGEDSALYVQVPWDLLMKYQQRAEKFYAAAPSNAKLRTLIRLDLEERGQWTHRFATHVGMSLGAVIKEVSSQSHLHWPRALFPSLASWRLDQPLPARSDGAAFETVIRYMQWIQDQPALLSKLHQLREQTLVCDCPHSQLCHGDVLAAMIWEAFPPTKSRSTASCPSRWVLAAASGTRVVSSMPISFRQEEVVSAFQSRCFSVNWDKFKFPLIEDLLLDPCFLAFRNWRQEHCLHQGLPAGPRVVSQCERPMFHMALGVQTGAGASGKAAPPLIP